MSSAEGNRPVAWREYARLPSTRISNCPERPGWSSISAMPRPRSASLARRASGR